MFKKALHFIKYNNFAILILVLLFILGGSVFASETGQKIVGGKEVRIEGYDNSLLLSADLDNLKMDFAVEKIEADEENYYITYTFIDLTPVNESWQYLLREKELKISKKLNEDLGAYLGKELSEEYQARIKELKIEQEKDRVVGEKKRQEVTEYTGLIGKVLDLSNKVFDNYSPTLVTELPSPVNKLMLTEKLEVSIDESSPSDNLTKVYSDFLKKSDPDSDNIFYENDNCPEIFNPNQQDKDSNDIGDACEVAENNININNTDLFPIPAVDVTENVNVEIIDLNNIPTTTITPDSNTETINSVDENISVETNIESNSTTE